jgi:hypothetical protein
VASTRGRVEDLGEEGGGLPCGPAWPRVRVCLSGSDPIGGSGPQRNNVFRFPEKNFHSMQNSIEIWEKYLETSEKYETFSIDILWYLTLLLY